MFTTMRQYRCDPQDAAEVARRADADFADRLAAEEGFVAYEFIDCGDGTIFTLTVFTDRDGAERSSELAADFVATLEGLSIERLSSHTGAVLINRARNDVLELVHA